MLSHLFLTDWQIPVQLLPLGAFSDPLDEAKCFFYMFTQLLIHSSIGQLPCHVLTTLVCVRLFRCAVNSLTKLVSFQDGKCLVNVWLVINNPINNVKIKSVEHRNMEISINHTEGVSLGKAGTEVGTFGVTGCSPNTVC